MEEEEREHVAIDRMSIFERRHPMSPEEDLCEGKKLNLELQFFNFLLVRLQLRKKIRLSVCMSVMTFCSQ